MLSHFDDSNVFVYFMIKQRGFAPAKQLHFAVVIYCLHGSDASELNGYLPSAA
jgi:hypothetical protein